MAPISNWRSGCWEETEGRALKAWIAILALAATASGGLTLKGAETLGPRCDAFLERAGCEAASRAGKVAARIAGLTARPTGAREPGPTLALVVTDGAVVGLDPDGYVTSVDEAFAGGSFPAMTGISLKGPLEDPLGGRRMSKPEITVGLSVTKAFQRHQDLFMMLSEVNVSDVRQPRAILKGGTIVEIGTGDYSRKIDRLRQVLIQAPHLGMCPRRIDLRFSRQVIMEYSQVPSRARKEV
jgi:hypothetical protein